MRPILLISTELGVGGAEKGLVEIALRLPKHGYAPTVVSLQPRPAPPRDALVTRLESAGVRVHFLDLAGWRQLPSAVGRLQRLMRETKTPLALSFLFHANVVTAWAARRCGVRHWAGMRVADPRGWRNWIEAKALGRCEEVICVSERVRRHFGRYFRDAERLTVIPNGVSPFPSMAAADLTRIGVGEEAKVVLFIGRLHPQKGLMEALPAVGRALEENPDAHFVLVGDGPQRDALERAALKLPCAERVHFLGFQQEVGPYLKRARCLLLPSQWEGMPNVVLEAMAAGLPVIATEESSAGELLDAEFLSQQVFHFGDETALAEKLSPLLRDDALAAQLGAANRAAAARFSWDAVADAYAQRFSR